MLYYETIDAPTLELLKNLLNLPDFSDLRLAGGTHWHYKSATENRSIWIYLEQSKLMNCLFQNP